MPSLNALGLAQLLVYGAAFARASIFGNSINYALAMGAGLLVALAQALLAYELGSADARTFLKQHNNPALEAAATGKNTLFPSIRKLTTVVCRKR